MLIPENLKPNFNEFVRKTKYIPLRRLKVAIWKWPTSLADYAESAGF